MWHGYPGLFMRPLTTPTPLTASAVLESTSTDAHSIANAVPVRECSGETSRKATTKRQAAADAHSARELGRHGD
jgi:hypothetical protein